MDEKEILVSVRSNRARFGAALVASLAVAGALIAAGAPAQASTVAAGAQTSVAAVSKPASPSKTLITQVSTAIHKKKGLGKGVKTLDVSTYAAAPAWVYVHADSKKFGPVDVLLQYSAKKWHVKDSGTAEVGCGTAPTKLLKAMGQTCPNPTTAPDIAVGKAAGPSSKLISQISTAIHKKKGLGKGVKTHDVSAYSVAPTWVYTHANSKKFGPVDVLLQYSAKKWHVRDYGTSQVGCGTAPKKLLKALDQDCS